jgi:hypothetical protein
MTNIFDNNEETKTTKDSILSFLKALIIIDKENASKIFDKELIILKVSFVVLFIALAYVNNYQTFIKSNTLAFYIETLTYGICGVFPFIYMAIFRKDTFSFSMAAKYFGVFFFYIFITYLLEVGGIYSYLYENDNSIPQNINKLLEPFTNSSARTSQPFRSSQPPKVSQPITQIIQTSKIAEAAQTIINTNNQCAADIQTKCAADTQDKVLQYLNSNLPKILSPSQLSFLPSVLENLSTKNITGTKKAELIKAGLTQLDNDSIVGIDLLTKEQLLVLSNKILEYNTSNALCVSKTKNTKLIEGVLQGVVIATCIISVITVLHMVRLTVAIMNTDYQRGENNRFIWFFTEALLFALFNSLPYYLIAYNRKKSNFNFLSTTIDIGLLIIKFLIMHIVLQYSGFYNNFFVSSNSSDSGVGGDLVDLVDLGF